MSQNSNASQSQSQSPSQSPSQSQSQSQKRFPSFSSNSQPRSKKPRFGRNMVEQSQDVSREPIPQEVDVQSDEEYGENSRSEQKHNNTPQLTHRQNSSEQRYMSYDCFITKDLEGMTELTERMKKFLDQETSERKTIDRLEAPNVQDSQRFADYYWPTETRLEAKLQFITSLGELSLETPVKLVAQYLLTWENLNMPQHTAAMIELFFKSDPIRMETVTRINLAFCNIFDPSSLEGTPFGDDKMTPHEFGRRVFRLSQLHEENVRWFRHMQASKDARTTGKPMAPLYEQPIIDDDAMPNSARDELKEEPHQLLLEFMFDRAGSQLLRRTETMVFEPELTPEGHNTRCYVYKMDIQPWAVRQVTPKTLFPAQFAAYTKSGRTPDFLASHLGHTPDPRFPFLTRCRTLWSFRNGIYNAHNNQFYVYLTPETPLGPNIHSVYELDPHVSTAKYFDCVIPLEWFTAEFAKDQGYKAIPVPEHEQIFKYQDYDEIELDWAESLFGRLQHDIGELEDWQIALHFQGPGKTGKSVLLNLIKLWYLVTDVGLIGDDVEKTFSDQHLLGKFIVLCMDISRDFGLTPTRFLSWVSGEWLIVMRKFKEAIAVKWSAPTLFASNGDPPVASSGGAGPRRWVILKILKAVMKSDGKLFKRAQKEIPYFIIKCSMAYHHKVDMYGDQGLWDNRNILPEKFWQARDTYTQHSSWPDAFLHEPGMFEVGTNYTQDEFSFRKAYGMFVDKKKHLQGVNSKRATMTVECTAMEFANALNDLDVGEVTEDNPKCRWDTETKTIMGLRFVQRLDDSKSEDFIADAPQQRRQYTLSSSSNTNYNNKTPAFVQPQQQIPVSSQPRAGG